MTFEQLVAQFGFPLAALVIVVATGARGTWVFGRELREADERAERAEKREEEWKQIALKSLTVSERAVK